MTMNKMTIIGNLGRDPEMRYTPSGQAVTNFTVATNRKYTGCRWGEPRNETEWFRGLGLGAGWRRRAISTWQRGERYYVEGRLTKP